MINEIYLDMDDVLNTFCQWAFPLFGLEGSHDACLPELGWDFLGTVNTRLGLKGLEGDTPGVNTPWTVKTLWDQIPPGFWATIPKSNMCDRLVQFSIDAVGVKNVYIATSPTKCKGSHGAKVEWIETFLPRELHRQYFVTPRKYKLAAKGRLLIDDCFANVDKWAVAGGEIVNVPRPWNPLHAVTGDAEDYVFESLQQLEFTRG